MKVFRKISAVLLVIGIIVATFFACNKEKGQAYTQSIDDVAFKKPIATYNTITGQMVYHFTTNSLQKVLEQSSVGKSNEFVIESLEIISLNEKDDEEEFIQFSFIDTENEKAYKTYLNSEFLEKKFFNDSIAYYIAEDVLTGNFSFTNFLKDGTFTITLSDFEVVDVETIPDSLLCYAPRPKRTVSCASQGCNPGGCVVYKDMYNNPVGCTPCGKPFSETVFCHQTVSYSEGGDGNIPAWIGIGLTILFGLLPFI